MAVTLSPEDEAKLGPSAKAQIAAASPKRKLRAVSREERPAAPMPPRLPRSNPAVVKRKVRAQRERATKQRQAARSARIGTIRTVGVRAGRGTSRAAGRIPSNVSASGLFGVVTGAALIGALVYRADTISALLGHMTAYWQRVIGLGKAAK